MPVRPADEDDSRFEPIFLDGPVWIDLDDAELVAVPLDSVADEAQLVGFEEFALSDTPQTAEEFGLPPAARSRPPAGGLACSLGAHLLALLVLLSWSTTTGEMLGTIPVQLV